MLKYLPAHTIFAHRGASAYAPENTMAAFKLAIRQGIFWIELDVKLSADNVVMVIHDQSVDRTTSGNGLVNNFTYSELKKLDAGSHFDIAFREEPIPSLEEVFIEIRKFTLFNIELTNYRSPNDTLPVKVADLISTYRMNERVLISSFNPLALMRFHRILPEIPIGLLALPGIKGMWARSWIGNFLTYQSLHLEIMDVSKDIISRNHNLDRKIFVYTVNNEDDMKRLFEMGVDGIFTDDPLLARQVLEGIGI